MSELNGYFTLTGTLEVRDKDGNLKGEETVDFGQITAEHASAIIEQAQTEGERQ